jgi:hypothetical protein
MSADIVHLPARRHQVWVCHCGCQRFNLYDYPTGPRVLCDECDAEPVLPYPINFKLQVPNDN